jgi:hypothetical protein
LIIEGIALEDLLEEVIDGPCAVVGLVDGQVSTVGRTLNHRFHRWHRGQR